MNLIITGLVFLVIVVLDFYSLYSELLARVFSFLLCCVEDDYNAI